MSDDWLTSLTDEQMGRFAEAIRLMDKADAYMARTGHAIWTVEDGQHLWCGLTKVEADKVQWFKLMQSGIREPLKPWPSA